ncbi:MAG: DUF4157 domain-containing protein [Bacteroidota bacterium]
MKRSTRKSRRHRNPKTPEESKKPFFSKASDTSIQPQSEQSFFQPKLTVGQPGDKYEQEADAVADAVVNKSNNTPAIQQKNISSIQKYATNAKEDEMGTNTQRIEKDKMIQEKPIQKMEGEEEESVQMMEEEESMQMKEEEEPIQKMEGEEEESVQMMEGEEEESVQMMEEEEAMQAKEEEEPIQKMEEEEESVQTKSNTTSTKNTASPQVAKQLKQSKGSGSSMPKSTQVEMEKSFGVDFSQVKVHTNDKAVQMNKDLGAQAFTHGKDVYFNEGKFSPTSKEGKRLLAHELTHVVQQGGAHRKNITSKNSSVSNQNKKTGNTKKRSINFTGGGFLGLIQRMFSRGKMTKMTINNERIFIDALEAILDVQKECENYEKGQVLDSSTFIVRLESLITHINSQGHIIGPSEEKNIEQLYMDMREITFLANPILYEAWSRCIDATRSAAQKSQYGSVGGKFSRKFEEVLAELANSYKNNVNITSLIKKIITVDVNKEHQENKGQGGAQTDPRNLQDAGVGQRQFGGKGSLSYLHKLLHVLKANGGNTFVDLDVTIRKIIQNVQSMTSETDMGTLDK